MFTLIILIVIGIIISCILGYKDYKSLRFLKDGEFYGIIAIFSVLALLATLCINLFLVEHILFFF